MKEEVGAVANLGPVIDFSDAAIFAMAVVGLTNKINVEQPDE
jgi:hypothetical protein